MLGEECPIEVEKHGLKAPGHAEEVSVDLSEIARRFQESGVPAEAVSSLIKSKDASRLHQRDEVPCPRDHEDVRPRAVFEGRHHRSLCVGAFIDEIDADFETGRVERVDEQLPEFFGLGPAAEPPGDNGHLIDDR